MRGLQRGVRNKDILSVELVCAPVWLADQRGYLRDEGLTVRLRSFGSTDGTMAALRDGFRCASECCALANVTANKSATIADAEDPAHDVFLPPRRAAAFEPE